MQDTTAGQQVGHTPGPWAIGIDSDSERMQVIAWTGDHVAYVECDPLDANARLIAAAPDLLEACLDAYALLINGEEGSDSTVDEVLATLRRAHAKATSTTGS
jgi:hypothetical protein